MTSLPTPARRWHAIRFGGGSSWSLPQLALAAAATLGVLLFLYGLWHAAGGFDPIWWVLGLVPMATISYAGSVAPLAYWALLLAAWFYLTPAGSFTGWSVPAGLGLLLAHAATALAATAPPGAGFGRATVRRWTRTTAAAALAAPAVALLTTLVSGRALAPSSAAYLIGLGGLTLGVFLMRTTPPDQPD